MGYGAPYCLNWSDFVNCQLIAICIMLTFWGYIYIQVMVYYNMDNLAVLLVCNGFNYPFDLF